MTKQMSPVHAHRLLVQQAREMQDAAKVTVHRCPNGTYETPDGVWVIDHSDEHWRTCEPHPGCDGHDVRFTVWTVGDTRTGYMAEWCEGYPTLRAAKAALARHITAYTYRVSAGEQCAVCGRPRPYDPKGTYDWWWHTTCRRTTDPEGAARYTTITGKD